MMMILYNGNGIVTKLCFWCLAGSILHYMRRCTSTMKSEGRESCHPANVLNVTSTDDQSDLLHAKTCIWTCSWDGCNSATVATYSPIHFLSVSLLITLLTANTVIWWHAFVSQLAFSNVLMYSDYLVHKFTRVVFSARGGTYTERATCCRPSVFLSVCHTAGSVRNGWNWEYAIFTVNQLDLTSFCGISFIWKFWRIPLSKQGWGGETSHFLALCVNILKPARDMSTFLLLMANRKLHICAFDWYLGRWPWMSLNCYKFEFSGTLRPVCCLSVNKNSN